jgi:hypothetical protein
MEAPNSIQELICSEFLGLEGWRATKPKHEPKDLGVVADTIVEPLGATRLTAWLPLWWQR